MKSIIITCSLLCVSLLAWSQDPAGDKKIVPVISTTKNTEFSPTISADGRTLIFESDVDKKKGWELFESRLDSAGNWSQPIPIKNINEKCNFLAGPSLSYDGNTLFYTAFIEGTTQSEDIFYSSRLDDKWSEPKSIGAPINTDAGYEGFPSISADGNSLYFIRLNDDYSFDKKSKEACFKIFVSTRTAQGTWGEPEMLPAPINMGCERDPKIMADNHTLIFSSIREGGKGKYDLYQTRKQPDGTWAEPVALNFINAEENDQSPCISASGDIMFYYSKNDLYSVPIPQEYRQMINITVQGYITAQKTGAPVPASIVVKSLTTGTEFTVQNSPSDGRYSIVLAAGQKYSVYYVNDNYLAESADFDFEKQDRYLEVKKDVSLKSEYIIELTVTDPDLKQPMKAWVSFTGPGITKNDSVNVDEYPLQFTLEAGKSYQIKTKAPKHPETNEVWKFDPLKMKPKMTHSVELAHEKVKYNTSVTNITSNQKVKVKVTFNNETVAEVIVADAGDVVYLRKGDRYQVVTSSDKGYFFSTNSLVAGDGERDADGNYGINIRVIPVEEGVKLTLNNILFGYNSADLDPSSYAELNKVVELMNINPGLSIEIAAHTDDVGADDFNLKLSEKRALSVVRYLLKQGTAPARLRPVGYGKSKPVAANETEEGRSKNRRVELIVLKIS